MKEKMLTFKEVCECVAKGEKIQGCLYRKDDSENEVGEWFDFIYDTGPGKPFIQTNYYNYRRKPATTVVPWDRTTCPGVGSVIHDKEGDPCMIIHVSAEGVFVGGHAYQNWDVLIKRGFTFNGNPCGMEVGQ